MRTLLILGAGGHGKVVAEIATSLGFEVSFLDDNPEMNVVGRIKNVKEFKDSYDEFIVGIGNNKIRHEFQDKLSGLGVKIATLVSPAAIVSPSANICEGSVIEPGTIVNTGVQIGRGCIVSVGSVVDHDSVLEDFSHVNTGAICMSSTHVKMEQKIEAGEIVQGFY